MFINTECIVSALDDQEYIFCGVGVCLTGKPVLSIICIKVLQNVFRFRKHKITDKLGMQVIENNWYFFDFSNSLLLYVLEHTKFESSSRRNPR